MPEAAISALRKWKTSVLSSFVAQESWATKEHVLPLETQDH